MQPNRILPLKVFSYISFLLITISCAQVKTPSGGDKDTTPPEIVQSFPKHLETNYNAKSIAITYNELVTLKNSGNIIITPPLKNKPKISLKSGNTLIISFNDTLQENTTYSINFGESIADYNEGNKLTDNLLVFSTGDYIDSLSIRGKIIQSENDTPCEDCKVMLYSTMEDSVVFKDKPYYFTKTNEQGQYQIDYLKSGNYKIIALQDEGDDYFYSPNEDLIGFSNDVVNLLPDTVAQMINISIFKQASEIQELLKHSSPSDQELALVFGKPITSLELWKDSVVMTKDEYFEIYNSNKDSISIWFKDIPKKNTEWKITILDNGERLDDFSLFFNNNKINCQLLSPSSKSPSNYNVRDTVLLKWSTPIKKIDTSKMKLTLDSTLVDFQTTIIDDFTLSLFFDKEEGQSFVLGLDSAAVTDQYDRRSDSSGISIFVHEDSYYGSLTIILPNKDTTEVLLLKNKGGTLIEKQKVVMNEPNRFLFLEPGTYSIYVLYDINQNLKWDSGNYLDKKQPERIYRHKEPIIIRSNWELELELNP